MVGVYTTIKFQQEKIVLKGKKTRLFDFSPLKKNKLLEGGMLTYLLN